MKSEAKKKEFIQFMLDCGVLRFGDFTTKSGRKTPYFLNTGLYRSGAHLSRLSEFYAEEITEVFGDEFDNLYGPAYKGIPLAVATAMTLHDKHSRNVTITFNRKEAKDHGEGGVLVGDQYSGGKDVTQNEMTRVVMIEDVVTAGTSVRESMSVLQHVANVDVVGLVVSVDRMEKGTGETSAIREIRENFGLRTASMVNLVDIIEFLKSAEKEGRPVVSPDELKKIEDYYLANACK
jgi:orotate phosphoribosyltransferase